MKLLFQIFTEREERKAIAVASNAPFSKPHNPYVVTRGVVQHLCSCIAGIVRSARTRIPPGCGPSGLKSPGPGGRCHSAAAHSPRPAGRRRRGFSSRRGVPVGWRWSARSRGAGASRTASSSARSRDTSVMSSAAAPAGSARVLPRAWPREVGTYASPALIRRSPFPTP
jgi:hypothetical protein